MPISIVRLIEVAWDLIIQIRPIQNAHSVTLQAIRAHYDGDGKCIFLGKTIHVRRR